MKRWAPLKFAALMLILTSIGCNLGRSKCCQTDCRPRAAGTLDPLAVIRPKPPDVRSDFAQVPPYLDVRRSFIDQNSADSPITLDLEESICLAAYQAPLARAIEDERRALACRLGPEHRSQAIEVFLEAQSWEQRNKAAANAGELFLRLVEVQLQHQLLDQSVDKFQELENALAKAEEAGFATEDGRSEINARAIQLKQKRSDLEIAQQEILIKLAALIGFDDLAIRLIQPTHELIPQFTQLNLEKEIGNAMAERPALLALQHISLQSSDDRVFSMLSQLDPRLGLNIVPPIAKRILRRRISNDVDPSNGIRRQQLQQIHAARQKQVRVEVAQAVLDIQGSLQKIALANEDLERLVKKNDLAMAKSEIDAKESFLDSIRIWVEQQQVQSERISAAIEHEVSQLRLLQATGQLARQCGFHFSIDCASP